MTGQTSADSQPGHELVSISESTSTTTGKPPPSKSDTAVASGKQQTENSDIPPPKTDKPRPHVCTTCGRCFARLEHLKRHERSHTKEKPFECPECTRCFARRDLLLRHQQKLHMTSAPSSRPKTARRESTSGAGPGSTRVRKNSIANNGNTGNNMRPRANTISHLDRSSLGIIGVGNPPSSRPPHLTHTSHPSLSSIPGLPNYGFRGLPSEQQNINNGLTKLDTGIPMDLTNGLRTAPVLGSFNEANFGDMILNQENNTINPAQLHFGSPHPFGSDTATSSFHQTFSGLPSQSIIDDDLNPDWLHGFENTMTFANANESAIDGSSPSAMSTGSQSGISEVMLDGSNQAVPSGISHRRFSQPTNAQFSCPGTIPRQHSVSSSAYALPSTIDLQRYIAAYVTYFHPHLPFLHISTLDFDSPEYSGSLKNPSGQLNSGSLPVSGGGGCLILSMAAIGAFLARAAELTHPIMAENLPPDQLGYTPGGGDMHMDGINAQAWHDHREWMRWKIVEERKRTLYAIFTLSSLLVSAYNHSPPLMNSEIRLDLPCDEQLWAAESAQAWASLGGTTAHHREIPFSVALTTLLTASHRRQSGSPQQKHFSVNAPGDDHPQSDVKPSTFGCLVLIHALHNYIWETRQRHIGRPWTPQETEAMHAHIEPALRAWQAAWSANPRHSLERPNPYGLGPLSADSIPLLDLAYIRLFVNLGRSKEAFWQRDWNGMADELARGAEIIQHADDPRADYPSQDHQLEGGNQASGRRASISEYGVADLTLTGNVNQEHNMQNNISQQQIEASRRERHLRKAAFYAADSISMSDKLGNTYAEFTSRELPIQSALCAFDCAQILAEWVTTIQERIGPYLGILGQDAMDLTQVPGIMLLEDEDYKLIQKIQEILSNVEAKMKDASHHPGTSGNEPSNCLPSLVDGGFGTKILFSTAYLLDRAAVWPVTKLMARALETQGLRMRERAQNSVLAG
ncbi:DNA binding regulatory protein AmdX [Histoplasma capsulatum]|uniref:DNA binding regulatory protein AmdX n=1 Tax=Ajellomyces capsulatus TaxID=5037 RepID=A0A8A1ML51_AJECA|nr:DNA binding regulatory protein AmdX [Histoplasma capsulatum]